MTIYEIDREILSLIDSETGEIKDFEYFCQLQMSRDRKIENTALLYKTLVAEAKAIGNEEKALADRRRTMEARAEKVKNYLDRILEGNKFESPKVAIKYRKSSRVEISDGFIAWAARHNNSLLTYKAPEPNKIAIKNYIDGGGECQYAEIITKNSISIK